MGPGAPRDDLSIPCPLWVAMGAIGDTAYEDGSPSPADEGPSPADEGSPPGGWPQGPEGPTGTPFLGGNTLARRLVGGWMFT